MEHILGQKMRPLIELRQFLADYKQVLLPDISPDQQHSIAKAMNLLYDEPRFNAIAESCSLEHLQQDDDVSVAKFVPGFSEIYRKNAVRIPAEAHKLKSYQKLLKAKANSRPSARNPYQRSREVYKLVALQSKDDTSINNFYDDLIVTVRTYRPARSTHVGQSLEKPVFAEEFECLGSNLLTELRDKIVCVCNKKRFFDVSEDPACELPDKLTDPGYFFITDTFYNDMRNPDNVDYSEVIRTWAKKASGVASLNFKVAKMEATHFLDLTVSLGFPQLYQHHGNCEHVFTISQLEVLTPNAECTTRSQYPRLKSFNFYNKRLCNMCSNMYYVFIVEHSNRQLHDPAYLCSKCFYSFHYVDGKKVGNFKAYRVNDYKAAPNADVSELDDERSAVSEAMDTSQQAQAGDDYAVGADESFSITADMENHCEFISVKRENSDI